MVSSFSLSAAALVVTGSALQPLQPLLPPGPPDATDTRQFRLQLKLINIDGTRFELSPYGGFRNYVKAKCNELGVRGYVWREPKVHGKILAAGTKDQLNSLIDFCEELVTAHYIETFEEERATQNIVVRTFHKLPSKSKHVVTGRFSNPKDDDVVSSTSSADKPVSMMGASI
jgi:acylphosphatase